MRIWTYPGLTPWVAQALGLKLWTKGGMERQGGLIEPGMLPNWRDLAQGRTEWVGKGGDWSSHTACHHRDRVGTQGLLTQSPTLCTVSHNLECGTGSWGKDSEEQESICQIHVFETSATV